VSRRAWRIQRGNSKIWGVVPSFFFVPERSTFWALCGTLLWFPQRIELAAGTTWTSRNTRFRRHTRGKQCTFPVRHGWGVLVCTTRITSSAVAEFWACTNNSSPNAAPWASIAKLAAVGKSIHVNSGLCCAGLKFSSAGGAECSRPRAKPTTGSLLTSPTRQKTEKNYNFSEVLSTSSFLCIFRCRDWCGVAETRSKKVPNERTRCVHVNSKFGPRRISGFRVCTGGGVWGSIRNFLHRAPKVLDSKFFVSTMSFDHTPTLYITPWGLSRTWGTYQGARLKHFHINHVFYHILRCISPPGVSAKPGVPITGGDKTRVPPYCFCVLFTQFRRAEPALDRRAPEDCTRLETSSRMDVDHDVRSSSQALARPRVVFYSARDTPYVVQSRWSAMLPVWPSFRNWHYSGHRQCSTSRLRGAGTGNTEGLRFPLHFRYRRCRGTIVVQQCFRVCTTGHTAVYQT